MNEINTEKINLLIKSIESSSTISVITHMKPDGDAIGSSIAMASFIMSFFRKDVRIILPDSSPEYLDFIAADAASVIIVHEKDASKAERRISMSDLIFCLDFNGFQRTGNLENTLAAAKGRKVLIDHHLFPERGSFALSFSMTDISSTSELLYHILTETEIIGHDASRLPSVTATALMTGMTTDTNNFQNSVYPSTFRMASELIAAGVDRDRILYCLYNEYREERLRLLGLLLKDRMTITPDGVAYIILDSATAKQYGIRDGETEGFVNIPLSLSKVRMSCFIKEDKDRFRVSLRSKKGISANRCASMYFGGGGHELAAGGKILITGKMKDSADVREYIEEVTHEFMAKHNGR